MPFVEGGENLLEDMVAVADTRVDIRFDVTRKVVKRKETDDGKEK